MQSTRGFFKQQEEIPSDELGLDPFQLRKIEPNLTKISASTTLVDILTQVSLTSLKPDVLPRLATSLSLNELPGLVHFIWVGSVFSCAKARSRLETWVTHNSDKVIILWTDQFNYAKLEKDLSHDDKKNMYQWAQINHIILLSIHDVFSGNMPDELERFYKAALLKPNYATASDLLRIWILERFGGIYADVDISCNRPIGKITLAPGFGLRVNAMKRRWGEIITSSPNNDLIYAHPSNSTLREYRERMLNNGRCTLNELMARHELTFGKIENPSEYDPFCFSMPYFSESPDCIYKLSEQFLTGPSAFHHFLTYKYGNYRSNPDILIDIKPFNFFLYASWAQPKNMRPHVDNRETALEKIITNLLFDLKRDPCILRLDAYATIINEFNLLENILIFLGRIPAIALLICHLEVFDIALTPRAYNVLFSSNSPYTKLKESVLSNIKNSYSYYQTPLCWWILELTRDVLSYEDYQELKGKLFIANISHDTITSERSKQMLSYLNEDDFMKLKQLELANNFFTESCSQANIYTIEFIVKHDFPLPYYDCKKIIASITRRKDFSNEEIKSLLSLLESKGLKAENAFENITHGKVSTRGSSIT